MSSVFKLVIPESINDVTLISTNVPENDHPLYDGGATYSINDTVMYIATDTHWIIRSKVDGNTGNIPTGLDSDPNWVRITDTNRWRMFDQKTSSQTVMAGILDATVLSASIADTGAFLNIDAASYTLIVKDDQDNEVINQSDSLVDYGNVVDWYTFMFAPLRRRKNVVISDIPPYANATYRLILDNGDSEAKCGTFLIGKQDNLAITRYGSSISNIDYSIKEANEFGDFQITERPYSQKMNILAYLEKDVTDYTVQALNDYRATPVLYIGTEATSYESTYLYGFYKNWEIDYNFPNYNQLEIELQSLS